MRIKKVGPNYRKKVFEFTAGKQFYEFPYFRLALKSTDFDGVAEVLPSEQNDCINIIFYERKYECFSSNP